MIKIPPDWKKILNIELIKKTLNNDGLLELTKKAQKEYVYWDKFRYYSFPNDIKAEEAWALLKFTARFGNSEKTPIKSIKGGYFIYNLPSILQQKLNFIDVINQPLNYPNYDIIKSCKKKILENYHPR